MRTFFKKLSYIATLGVGAVALFVLGSFLPIEGNYTFRIVQSGSMEPAIKTGAVIATIPRASYEVGDIVTFAGTDINPMPTTHRIVESTNVGDQVLYTTKGDANEDVDYRQVRADEILGKVFMDVPYVGYMASFFATANGKAVLVTIVIIAFFLGFTPWNKILVTQEEKHEE